MEPGSQSKVKPVVPPKPSIRIPRSAVTQKGPVGNLKAGAFPASPISKSSTPKHDGDGPAAFPASSPLHDQSVAHAVGAAGQEDGICDRNGVIGVQDKESSTAPALDSMASDVGVRRVEISFTGQASLDETHQNYLENNNNNNVKGDPVSDATTQQLTTPDSATPATAEANALDVSCLPNKSPEANANEQELIQDKVVSAEVVAAEVSDSSSNGVAVVSDSRPRPVPKKRISVKKDEEVIDSPGDPNRKSFNENVDQPTGNSTDSDSCPVEGNSDGSTPLRPPRRPKHLRKSYLKCRSASNLGVDNGDESNLSLSVPDDEPSNDSPETSRNINMLGLPPRKTQGATNNKPVRSMKNSKSDSQVNRLAANISGVVDLRLKEQLSGRPKPPVKPKPGKISIKSPSQEKPEGETCKHSDVDASQNTTEPEDSESNDVITPMPHHAPKGVRVLPTNTVTQSESNLTSQEDTEAYGHMWLAAEGSSNMSLSSQTGDAMSRSMLEDSDSKQDKSEARCRSMVFETEAKGTRPLFLRTQSEQAISCPPRVPIRKAPLPPRTPSRSKCPPAQRPNVPPPKAPPLLVPLSKKPNDKVDPSDSAAEKDDGNNPNHAAHAGRESLYDAEGYLQPKSSDITSDDVYSYAQLPGQILSPGDEGAVPPPPPIHPRPAKRPRSLSATPVLVREPKGESDSTGSEHSRDSQGSEKRSSIMGHFYEMIRAKSMKSKRKHEEPSTRSVFYCEADTNKPPESQCTVEESINEKPFELSADTTPGTAPPLPARNPCATPLERSSSLNGPGEVPEIKPQLDGISESVTSPERDIMATDQSSDDPNIDSLLDTPVIPPAEDEYDDAASPGIEPYAATDIINNPAIEVSHMDDMASLDMEIPAPTESMKRRRINHGYTGDGGTDENPYDETPGAAEAVRDRFSAHTYEATSDLESDTDSEADSDGYIYPDAQNLPHIANGRTEAPSAPAPPTPRHRDVPAPPPLPRRSTSIQSQPPLPQRTTSLQSQPVDLTPVPVPIPVAAEKSSTMGHEYSEPQIPCCDVSDSDSDLYDDAYKLESMPCKEESSPEYHVYDASSSETKDEEASENASNQDSNAVTVEEVINQTPLLPDGIQRVLESDSSKERPESWASSGSDHLSVAPNGKPSRWSGSSFVSGSSCGPSLSDHSDADFEDAENGEMKPRSISTMRKDESKEKQAKRKAKAFHIVKEIMTTEESFINDLNILKDFREAMLQSFHNRPELIQHVAKQMFKYLLELQKVNEDLLKDVSVRVKNWETNPAVADIFVKKGPFLKLYTAYIREFESSTDVFEEARKKYPEFDKFSKGFEEMYCKKLALKHYMLKPIQRIPQYRLLLLDYLNQLMEDTEEYTHTKAALAILNDVAEHANESAKYRDNLKKLQEIQSSLIGDFEVIKPGRYFIKEGILQKLSRKEMQPRMFYLLNDVLLCTTHTPGGYKLKNVIPLTDFKVSLPTKEDFQNEFNMISTQRSFTVAASTPEVRDAWLKAFQEAVQEDSSKRDTFNSRRFSLINLPLPVDLPDSEVDTEFKLGSEAPVWVPDARVSMCMLCTHEFTIAFRRHHCRACGKIVCGHCSDYKAPLKYLTYKAARVCSICYKTLRNEVKDGPPVPEGVMSRFKWSQATSHKSKVKRPAVLHEVKANDEDAEMSGYLKVWKGNKWKKKWFVLKDKALFTFKASEDAAAVESLVLLGYEIRTFSTWFEGIEPRLVFEIAHTGTTEITFRTESESSRDKWIAALRLATQP